MAAKFNIFSNSGSGKGLKIFESTSYKEHEQIPVARKFWELRWDVIIWIICALAFGFSFVIEHILRYGWGPASEIWSKIFIEKMFMTFGFSVVAEIPFWISRTFTHPDYACIIPLLPIIVYYFLSDDNFKNEFNPHSKDRYEEKSSRKATADDIKKMGQDFTNKEGLFHGFMMVLGYFKYKGKQTALMLDDTLSTLCVAPPGTGKSAGIVIPTILDCDGVSMIINDPKPELKQRTSGYRSTVGPVFIMNWAGQDEPEKGIYYPSWNPLSPEHVPYNMEQRDLYVDAICKVLVQDSVQDPHWANTGRAGLAGLIHFIISKFAPSSKEWYNKSYEKTDSPYPCRRPSLQAL